MIKAIHIVTPSQDLVVLSSPADGGPHGPASHPILSRQFGDPARRAFRQSHSREIMHAGELEASRPVSFRTAQIEQIHEQLAPGPLPVLALDVGVEIAQLSLNPEYLESHADRLSL
jgi:hypothetical protein